MNAMLNIDWESRGGEWVSNLKAENATWCQLSILYKIKTGSKLIKKKNNEQK